MSQFFIIISLIAASTDASAREIVVSDTSNDVNVTVYRDPSRGNQPINANWPSGYALISEKREIIIPKGEAVIRFEGVSEGLLPETALVSGLPNGVVEKNRDERLLSPFGLVDAYLKRRVTIKRTSAATGETVEKDVFISAGPSGGVVFEGDDGFEALRCTGLPERMIFDEVPQGLSAKPTLSVITESDREVRAVVTLTYLASGFDWQANYIANIDSRAKALSGGDKKLNLFAWLTVANGGNQNFNNANLLAVAGTPNRERAGPQVSPTGEALRLQCWPQGRTDQVPFRGLYPVSALSPVSDFAEAEDCAECDVIIMTGNKINGRAVVSFSPVAAIAAEQENLGDLKLYRIPERVDVKAKGQKQVAMIIQPDVEYKRIFAANVERYDENGSAVGYILRSKNSKDKGLGLPLPSGQFSVFEDSFFGPLLIGEGALEDNAIDNDVELTMPQVSDVRMSLTHSVDKPTAQSYRVKITNALNHSIKAEIKIPYRLKGRNPNVRDVDGVPTWFVTVPANGDSSLQYSLKLERD